MKNQKFHIALLSAFFAFMVLMTPATPVAAQPVFFDGAIYPTGFGGSGIPSQNSGSGSGSGSGQYGGSGSFAQGISVTCSPSTSSAGISEPVTWFSSATGGTGSYSYFWGGSDGLNGNTSSVRYAYATQGTKFATLTAVSGGQSVTVNCTAPVTIGSGSGASFGNSFGVSCYAAEDRILPGESGTWLSVSTGLNAATPTTYTWEGTEGLTGTGPAAFKTYTTNGRKFAILTVTSGSMRTTVGCTNHITVGPRVVAVARAEAPASKPAATTTPETALAALQGVCNASVAEAETGKEVIWQATVVGGTGAYYYIWQGDEALNGTATTTSKIYTTEGTKNAAVQIASGNNTLTVTCPKVEVKAAEENGLMAGGIFRAIFGNPLVLIIGALAAAAFGIYLAMRKRRREEAEEEDTEKKH